MPRRFTWVEPARGREFGLRGDAGTCAGLRSGRSTHAGVGCRGYRPLGPRERCRSGRAPARSCGRSARERWIGNDSVRRGTRAPLRTAADQSVRRRSVDGGAGTRCSHASRRRDRACACTCRQIAATHRSCRIRLAASEEVGGRLLGESVVSRNPASELGLRRVVNGWSTAAGPSSSSCLVATSGRGGG
jgi:hypothetical protein